MGNIVLNFNRLGIYSDPHSDMGLQLNLSPLHIKKKANIRVKTLESFFLLCYGFQDET